MRLQHFLDTEAPLTLYQMKPAPLVIVIRKIGNIPSCIEIYPGLITL